MNTYEVWCEDKYGEAWCKRTYPAETAGKAKYEHWYYMQDGIWEESFGVIVKFLRCRKIGGFKVSDLFGNREKFERVCEKRGISFAYQGMRIEVGGQLGTIVGGNDSLNLDVVFDGKYYAENCHPWWRTKYFDRKGTLIKEFMD
ncbi:hypothetical protein [Paenibacillus elgii]|uniref:hypothetical protein n=1 Tax=Paenibacillus elgii TaxID=189691 RepID=UPI000248D913|nr:hypothetical protein [Paenibacillus elgii]